MMRSAPFVIALALLVVGSQQLDAGLILNGSFENSTGGSPNDWTSTGNLQVISSQGETDGANALAFSFNNQPSTGVLSQTFSTVLGTTYRLNFDFGKYSINQPLQSARLDVDIIGGGFGLLDVTVVDSTPGSGDANSTDSPTVYSPFQFTFTAIGNLTTLRFTDVSDAQSTGGGFDAMLDNVDVNVSNPVPEPSSLAIFGLVITLTGAVRYRRRQTR